MREAASFARTGVEDAMRALFAAVVVVGSAAAVNTTLAADLYRGPAPYAPPAPAYYKWGDVTHLGGHPSGILGGAQIGYNWQASAFVFGLETDIQLSGADDTFAPYKFSNPWFGTLRGRIGYA